MKFGEVFITPAIDILIFVCAVYGVVYYVYHHVFKTDTQAMMSADIKISFATMLFIIAYYYGSGVEIVLFGIEFHWFVYYILVSSLVEFLLFIIYKNIHRFEWSELFGIQDIQNK